MSSAYRILCLSHDPAITVGGDYTTGYQSPSEAESAITRGIDEHSRCDLLIGRYSYGLAEVGCPPNSGRPRRPGQRCYHSVTEWVDAAWLRILAAVHQSGDEEMRALTSDGHLSCWPWGRLRLLRGELDFPIKEPTP